MSRIDRCYLEAGIEEFAACIVLSTCWLPEALSVEDSAQSLSADMDAQRMLIRETKPSHRPQGAKGQSCLPWLPAVTLCACNLYGSLPWAGGRNCSQFSFLPELIYEETFTSPSIKQALSFHLCWTSPLEEGHGCCPHFFCGDAGYQWQLSCVKWIQLSSGPRKVKLWEQQIIEQSGATAESVNIFPSSHLSHSVSVSSHHLLLCLWICRLWLVRDVLYQWAVLKQTSPGHETVTSSCELGCGPSADAAVHWKGVECHIDRWPFLQVTC